MNLAVDLAGPHSAPAVARVHPALGAIDTAQITVVVEGAWDAPVAANDPSPSQPQAARWKAMAKLLSEPTLPSDLRK